MTYLEGPTLTSCSTVMKNTKRYVRDALTLPTKHEVNVWSATYQWKQKRCREAAWKTRMHHWCKGCYWFLRVSKFLSLQPNTTDVISMYLYGTVWLHTDIAHIVRPPLNNDTRHIVNGQIHSWMHCDYGRVQLKANTHQRYMPHSFLWIKPVCPGKQPGRYVCILGAKDVIGF